MVTVCFQFGVRILYNCIPHTIFMLSRRVEYTNSLQDNFLSVGDRFTSSSILCILFKCFTSKCSFTHIYYILHTCTPNCECIVYCCHTWLQWRCFSTSMFYDLSNNGIRSHRQKKERMIYPDLFTRLANIEKSKNKFKTWHCFVSWGRFIGWYSFHSIDVSCNTHMVKISLVRSLFWNVYIIASVDMSLRYEDSMCRQIIILMTYLIYSDVSKNYFFHWFLTKNLQIGITCRIIPEEWFIQ